MALASRAISSAALGPGSGVVILGRWLVEVTPVKVSTSAGLPVVASQWWRGEDQGQPDVLDPPGHQRRRQGDRRDLQLGGQPDLRDDRLRASEHRGGGRLVGN